MTSYVDVPISTNLLGMVRCIDDMEELLRIGIYSAQSKKYSAAQICFNEVQEIIDELDELVFCDLDEHYEPIYEFFYHEKIQPKEHELHRLLTNKNNPQKRHFDYQKQLYIGGVN